MLQQQAKYELLKEQDNFRLVLDKNMNFFDKKYFFSFVFLYFLRNCYYVL